MIYLCRCRDVTLADVERAVAAGFDHPETIKRATTALTGPCQGRACADLVLQAIERLTGATDADRPSNRPPSFAVRLGDLAGGPQVDP